MADKHCHLPLSPPVCSSRAESKCSQRQQKALSSTVHRLSENVKQLQQENGALREELNTDSPAGGIKGLSSLTHKHTDMPVPEPHTLTTYTSFIPFHCCCSASKCDTFDLVHSHTFVSTAAGNFWHIEIAYCIHRELYNVVSICCFHSLCNTKLNVWEICIMVGQNKQLAVGLHGL